MPRLVNSQTGVIVNVDEETAENLGREWSAAKKAPAKAPPAAEAKQESK